MRDERPALNVFLASPLSLAAGQRGAIHQWMFASEFYFLFLLISYCDLLHMMVTLQRIHIYTRIQYSIQHQLHINYIILLHVMV